MHHTLQVIPLGRQNDASSHEWRLTCPDPALPSMTVHPQRSLQYTSFDRKEMPKWKHPKRPPCDSTRTPYARARVSDSLTFNAAYN